MLTIVAHEGCTNRFAEGALFALVLQYTNQVIHKVMAKHHIVQDKYLTQLRKTGTENQLNIYVISENELPRSKLSRYLIFENRRFSTFR